MKEPNPEPDFDRVYETAKSRATVLLELARVKALETEDRRESEFWMGVAVLVRDLWASLDRMRELNRVIADRLFVLEHPKRDRELTKGKAKLAKRQRQASSKRERAEPAWRNKKRGET